MLVRSVSKLYQADVLSHSVGRPSRRFCRGRAAARDVVGEPIVLVGDCQKLGALTRPVKGIGLLPQPSGRASISSGSSRAQVGDFHNHPSCWLDAIRPNL